MRIALCNDRRLETAMCASRLLAVDEIGYLPVSHDGSALFF